jgi:hypothetical protein
MSCKSTLETARWDLLLNERISQHRVSPFKLIDPTKKGHRRFIALWLVDPTKRVISTANVPPQQMSWYADELLGTDPATRKQALKKMPLEVIALLQKRGLRLPELVGLGAQKLRLPEELMEMIREYLESDGQYMPMGVEEAREHRSKLMQERGAFVKTSVESWHNWEYNFCEH